MRLYQGLKQREAFPHLGYDGEYDASVEESPLICGAVKPSTSIAE